MKTILMSGGHLTPALAIIDQAKKNHKQYKFVFMGRVFSQDSSKQLSQEKSEVEKRDVQFIPTVAPKFHKTFWWKNLAELNQLIPAFVNAWKVSNVHKPDLFISFGGYLALPIAIVCRLRRIPVITHEQTTSQGMANKVIAMVSDRVAVSHKSSLELYPSHKTVLTGNPVRPAVTNKRPARPDWIKKTPTKPVLYVTGGNQGSEILNSVMEQTLGTLTRDWFVIHQCGNPSEKSNYLKRLETAKSNLSTHQQNNYFPQAWLNETDLSWVFAHAKVAVSRSGANTIQELIIHSLPAVLIPLPFAHNQEQLKNAQMLADANCALILEQKDLTPETFLKKIKQVSNRNKSMSNNYAKLHKSAIINGSENLLKLMEEVMKDVSESDTLSA